MKAGNREINIFNMSLLDILCGAMGAFCFMMVALFPYYSVNGPASAEALKDRQELERQVEEMRKRLEQAGPAGEAALELLKQLQAQIQKLQGQLNAALNRNEELRKENDQLRMRNPIAVTMTWMGAGHDLDVHVYPANVKTTAGKSPEPVDPNKKQGTFFSGESASELLSGPGTEAWLIRDTASGGRYEIHFKFIEAQGTVSPQRVTGMFLHEGKATNLPAVTLSQPRTSVHVGTLVIGNDYSVKFEPSEATKEIWERMMENERKRNEQKKEEKKGSEPPK